MTGIDLINSQVFNSENLHRDTSMCSGFHKITATDLPSVSPSNSYVEA